MYCNSDSDDSRVTMQIQQNESYQDKTLSNKLTAAEKEAVMPLMHAYSDIFSDKWRVAKVASHRLELNGDTPVSLKPYSELIRLMEAVKKELEDLEESRVVERSTSSYSNPMVDDSKKDEHVRLFAEPVPSLKWCLHSWLVLIASLTEPYQRTLPSDSGGKPNSESIQYTLATFPVKSPSFWTCKLTSSISSSNARGTG